MKPKQPSKRYQTDLRINATPHQVASALVCGGAPRREECKPAPKQKRLAS